MYRRSFLSPAQPTQLANPTATPRSRAPGRPFQRRGHRWRLALLAVLIVGLGACDDGGDDADSATLQISYEAIPGTGVMLDQGSIDASSSTYDDRAAFTSEVFAMLVPDIKRALGVEPDTVDSQLSPGGFLLETNPAMHTRFPPSPDVGETADRLAAALGYVMFQWSVLVADFEDPSGDTSYGIVRFLSPGLTPDRAQAFFVHAGEVEPGLSGGYSAFGDEMVFLNLRDTSGVPFSGIDDQVFLAALAQAADSFDQAELSLSETGTALARLVENNWVTASDGGEYLSKLDPALKPTLDELQDRFEQHVSAAASSYGWQVSGPASARAAATNALRRGHSGAFHAWRASRR